MVTSLLLSIIAQEELESESTAVWGDMNYVKKQTKITSFLLSQSFLSNSCNKIIYCNSMDNAPFY